LIKRISNTVGIRCFGNYQSHGLEYPYISNKPERTTSGDDIEFNARPFTPEDAIPYDRETTDAGISTLSLYSPFSKNTYTGKKAACDVRWEMLNVLDGVISWTFSSGISITTDTTDLKETNYSEYIDSNYVDSVSDGLKFFSINNIFAYRNLNYTIKIESVNDIIQTIPQTPFVDDSPYGDIGNPEIVVIKNTSSSTISPITVLPIIPPYKYVSTSVVKQKKEEISDSEYKNPQPYFYYSTPQNNYIEISIDGVKWFNQKDVETMLFDSEKITQEALQTQAKNILYNNFVKISSLAPNETVNFYIRTNIPNETPDIPIMFLLRIIAVDTSTNQIHTHIHPVYIRGNRQGTSNSFVFDTLKKTKTKKETKASLRYYELKDNWQQTLETPVDMSDITIKLGINKSASTATITHRRKYEEIGEIKDGSLVSIYANDLNLPLDESIDILYVGSVVNIQQTDDEDSTLTVQTIDGMQELNFYTVDYVYINTTVADIVKDLIDNHYTGNRISYNDDSIGGTFDADGNYTTNEPVNNTVIDYIVFENEELPNALYILSKQIGANFWIEPEIDENGYIKEILYFRIPNTNIDKVYYRGHDIQNYKKTTDSSNIINEIILNGGNVIEKIEGQSTFQDQIIFSNDTTTIELEYPINQTKSSGIWELYALPQGFAEGESVMNFSYPSGEGIGWMPVSGFFTTYVPSNSIIHNSGIYTGWNFVIVNGKNAGLQGTVLTTTVRSEDLVYNSTFTTHTHMFFGLDFSVPEDWTGFDITGENQDQFWIYPNDITITKTYVSGYSGFSNTNMGENLYNNLTDKTVFRNNVVFSNTLPNIKVISDEPVFDTGGFITTYVGNWAEERETTLKRTGRVRESIDKYGIKRKIYNESDIVSYNTADLFILSELDKYAFPKKSIEFDLPLSDISLKRNDLVNIRGFYSDSLKNASFFNKSVLGNSTTKWGSSINEDIELKRNVYSIEHTFKNGEVNTKVNLDNEEPRFDDTLKVLFEKLRKQTKEYNPLNFWNQIDDTIERPKDKTSLNHYNIGLDNGLKLEKYDITTITPLGTYPQTVYKYELNETYTSGLLTNSITGTQQGILRASTQTSGLISTVMTSAKQFYSDNQTFTVPHQDFMNFPNYTIEMIMKSTETYGIGYRYNYVKGTYNSEDERIGFGNNTTPTLQFYCDRTSTGANSATVDLGMTFNDGNWHYLVVTRYFNSGTVYVDGIKKGTVTTLPAIGFNASNTSAVVGTDNALVFYSWKCAIDTFIMHSGVIFSDSDIAIRYTNIFNPTVITKSETVEL
jgi:hypothetical protein